MAITTNTKDKALQTQSEVKKNLESNRAFQWTSVPFRKLERRTETSDLSILKNP